MTADPLLGRAEVAEMCGVARKTVNQWMRRQVMPERDATVDGGPAWRASTILNWAVATGRLDARGTR